MQAPHQATEQYLAYCKTKKLAPSSLSRYKAALAALLALCKLKRIRRLSEVKLRLLEAFDEFRTNHQGCQPKTVYTDSLIIKDFFKWAVHPARKLIRSNPAEAWEVRKPAKKQGYCFTQEEVDKLQAGCREWLRPILTTLAYSGLRIGELIHLRWEDVDLNAGFIHISVQDDWAPKGRRSRSVPLHPLVKAAIAPLPTESIYVFRGPKGGGIKENYTLEVFKRDRDKLGIQKGILHSFRHFFVSKCAQEGVPLATCMTWVGHRDAETVWHYYHLHDPASREAMERFARGTGA